VLERWSSLWKKLIVNASEDVLEAPWIPWLADAPLFIDQQQVGVFYDAVLRPAFRTVEIEVARDRTEELKKRFGANVGAKLPFWFPWLGGEIGVEGGMEKATGATDRQAVTLQPVESPGRQLVELSLHYLEKQKDRIWFPEGDTWTLPIEANIIASPRLLIFLDFPPWTKFMPMAAELNDGRVVTFFGPLVDKFKTEGGTLPKRYPDDRSDPNFEKDRGDYWDWFSEHWNANAAIQVIENVIGTGGRPRWIDYRVPISGPETIHLHVVGRGEFDTGVFAYNLVKRGWKHGLRVVGTLKSEPDVNVLAIYEK
jgi:hypothetical protein